MVRVVFFFFFCFLQNERGTKKNNNTHFFSFFFFSLKKTQNKNAGPILPQPAGGAPGRHRCQPCRRGRGPPEPRPPQSPPPRGLFEAKPPLRAAGRCRRRCPASRRASCRSRRGRRRSCCAAAAAQLEAEAGACGEQRGRRGRRRQARPAAGRVRKKKGSFFSKNTEVFRAFITLLQHLIPLRPYPSIFCN